MSDRTDDATADAAPGRAIARPRAGRGDEPSVPELLVRSVEVLKDNLPAVGVLSGLMLVPWLPMLCERGILICRASDAARGRAGALEPLLAQLGRVVRFVPVSALLGAVWDAAVLAVLFVLLARAWRSIPSRGMSTDVRNALAGLPPATIARAALVQFLPAVPLSVVVIGHELRLGVFGSSSASYAASEQLLLRLGAVWVVLGPLLLFWMAAIVVDGQGLGRGLGTAGRRVLALPMPVLVLILLALLSPDALRGLLEASGFYRRSPFTAYTSPTTVLVTWALDAFTYVFAVGAWSAMGAPARVTLTDGRAARAADAAGGRRVRAWRRSVRSDR